MRYADRIVTTSALAVAAAGLWLCSTPPAQAQDALGRGDALDANLRLGDRRNRPGRSIQSELRFRNALVTGNAPGGFSFRGDVGYTAPDDFRGETGSDDIFTFARDSVFSALGARGVPSTNALQTQMGLSTLPVISRPSAGFSGRELGVDPLRAPLGDLSIDPVSLRPRSLRSTTEFVSSLSLDPNVLSVGRDEDDRRLYTVASPLRGVVIQEDPGYPTGYGLGEAILGDEADADDAEEAVSPLDRPRRLDDRIEPGREELRESLRVDSERLVYEDLLQQFRDMAQEQREAAEERRREEDDAADPTDDAPSGAPDGVLDAPSPLDAELERIRQWLRVPAGVADDEDEAPDDESPDAERPSLDRTIELIDRFRPEIEALSPPISPQRNLYAEHMNRGQRLLEEGRWFDAEERFTSALMMRADDPLAAAGRVHAQLGAGMFLSAAVNLEQLLREHPELIGARYDAALLPSSQRLASVRDTLRSRLDAPGSRGRNAALLLAYLGYQVGDSKDVADAFSVLEADEETGAGDRLDPFIEIARRIWLGT